jgi:hypothetical protein
MLFQVKRTKTEGNACEVGCSYPHDPPSIGSNWRIRSSVVRPWLVYTGSTANFKKVEEQKIRIILLKISRNIKNGGAIDGFGLFRNVKVGV